MPMGTVPSEDDLREMGRPKIGMFDPQPPKKIFEDGWEIVAYTPNVAVFEMNEPKKRVLISFADGDQTFSEDPEDVTQLLDLLKQIRVASRTLDWRRSISDTTAANFNQAFQDNMGTIRHLESVLWDYKLYPDVAPWDPYGNTAFQEPTWIDDTNQWKEYYGRWDGFGDSDNNELNWLEWFSSTDQELLEDEIGELREREYRTRSAIEDLARQKWEQTMKERSQASGRSFDAKKYDFRPKSRAYFKSKAESKRTMRNGPGRYRMIGKVVWDRYDIPPTDFNKASRSGPLNKTTAQRIANNIRTKKGGGGEYLARVVPTKGGYVVYERPRDRKWRTTPLVSRMAVRDPRRSGNLYLKRIRRNG